MQAYRCRVSTSPDTSSETNPSAIPVNFGQGTTGLPIYTHLQEVTMIGIPSEYVQVIARFHDLPYYSDKLDQLPDPVLGTVQFTFNSEVDAREEWYSDFAERSQTQYDLLGHITDWLRTLSTSIENHYVVFENPDPWMITDIAEEKEREKPIIPPSIFDVPWATQKVPSLDFQAF